MRFSESEIVEEILEHIRQAGGEFSEWHVGTASRGGRQWAARTRRPTRERAAPVGACRPAIRASRDPFLPGFRQAC